MENNKPIDHKDLTDALKQIKAKDIMTKNVITVKKDDTLDDVAELMIKKRISGFPVLENNKIIGTITADDLFMVMDMIKTGEILKNNNKEYSLPRVEFAMSTELFTVSPDTDLDEIIALMKYRNIRTLPVTIENKMVGVIGRRDIYSNFYCALKGICPKT